MIELVEFYLDFLRQFFVDNTYTPKAITSSMSVSHEMLKMLNRHTRTGNHTDVLVWAGEGQYVARDHFKYSHSVRKPFGEVSPYQCNECKVLQPWKIANQRELNNLAGEYKKTAGIDVGLQKEARRALMMDPRNQVVLQCKTRTKQDGEMVSCKGAFVVKSDGFFNWFEATGSEENGFWQGARDRL